ncbi:MAG TPA: hypothetical protein VG734_11145 [Lacunisphaera sp.]|nr:hypothetical protein [Lacunisphaera sp.]
MKFSFILLVGAAAVLVYWYSTRKQTVTMIDPNELRFSQLDITERFDDQSRLKPDEWIQTTALNATLPNPEASGLPPKDAAPDSVYKIAADMSSIRERFAGRGDGVYCPVCHIANVDHAKLHAPCPKCGRKLLSFGWD